MLPGPAPGCTAPAPVAQCPEGLRSPRRGLHSACSLGRRRGPIPALWWPQERGVGHAKWQGKGLPCLGRVQGLHAWGYSRPKTNSYGSRIIVMALLCFLSCQRDLQAFVCEPGKMPRTELNQNSVCLFVESCLEGCQMLPGERLAQSPGTRHFPDHQASPFRLHHPGHLPTSPVWVEQRVGNPSTCHPPAVPYYCLIPSAQEGGLPYCSAKASHFLGHRAPQRWSWTQNPRVFDPKAHALKRLTQWPLAA